MPDLLILLIIVLVVVLVWRGPRILPEWGAALGRGIREARTHATKGLDDKPEPRTLDEGPFDSDLNAPRSDVRRETTDAPRP